MAPSLGDLAPLGAGDLAISTLRSVRGDENQGWPSAFRLNGPT